MHGGVHRKLVEDAVIFMNDGNDAAELAALWRLTQLAGGENVLLQKLCDEADWTDFYSDLQWYIPFPAMVNQTEWKGRWATGLHHYINAFLEPVNWHLASGYHFPWSSQTTMDDEFHSGWFDFFNVNIEDDPDKSLVLGRIPPYWLGQTRTWEQNWAARLPFSQYAPCSAVAATYYDHLLNHYHEPMHVSVYGNRPNRHELEKLGPILHFIGDTVVPQHVRAAHGFCHTEWEASVQTLVDNGLVTLDAQMVRDLLSAHPFKGWYYQGGPLDGLYAVDYTLVSLADMTRERVQADLDLDINALWAAGDPVWMVFFVTSVLLASDPKTAPASTMQYLYNLGVAACVHTLRRASEDLLRKNIGPVPPAFAPLQVLSEPFHGHLVSRPLAHTEKPYPSLRRDILPQLAPSSRARISPHIGAFEQIFMVNDIGAIEIHSITEALDAVEESVERELVDQGAQFAGETSTRFDSGFGLYSFRPPTMEECLDERQLRRYVERSEVHKYMVHLLNLTRLVATLNYYERQEGPDDEIERQRRSIQRQRRRSIEAKALPRPEPLPVPQETRLLSPAGRVLPPDVRKP